MTRGEKYEKEKMDTAGNYSDNYCCNIGICRY